MGRGFLTRTHPSLVGLFPPEYFRMRAASQRHDYFGSSCGVAAIAVSKTSIAPQVVCSWDMAVTHLCHHLGRRASLGCCCGGPSSPACWCSDRKHFFCCAFLTCQETVQTLAVPWSTGICWGHCTLVTFLRSILLSQVAMAPYAPQSSLLSFMFSIMGNIQGLGGGSAWAF